MNIDDIKKLDNLMKFEYAKDMNGEIISNGDVCVYHTYEPFIHYSNDNVVIDFSELSPKKISTTLNYEMLVSKWYKQSIDTDCVSTFYIMEYFKIDESHIWPFYHCYNGSNYRFWFDNEISKNYIKLKTNDLSKLLIRLPKNVNLDVVNPHLQKSVECNEGLDYIELQVKQFKCWTFILKALKGINQRERWTYKCNDFPRIHLNVNDSTENKFNIESLMKKDIYLKEFYNVSEDQRKVYMYCQHPRRNHKEYFYIYENDNIKEI